MRRTSTDKSPNRKKSRAIHLAASALAVTASLAGGAALADHKGHHQHQHGYHTQYDHSQDRYRHGPIYWKQQQKVRVKIPVRDHGPETLPLGRLIARNSNLDLDRYRLVAVVTKNGRFSNGYASLRTGNSKTQRYFLGSREKTWIPAPSRADSKWRLRLGPGTQVRSITAVLEPRRGWAHNKPTQRRHGSVYRQDQQVTNGTPLMSLAWLLSQADDDDRHRKQAKRMKRLRAEQARTEAELAETQRKLERSRERNKRLKDQRARLADELAHDRSREQRRADRRGEADDRVGKRKRKGEREVRRTVRYVVSAS